MLPRRLLVVMEGLLYMCDCNSQQSQPCGCALKHPGRVRAIHPTYLHVNSKVGVAVTVIVGDGDDVMMEHASTTRLVFEAP